MEFERFMVDLGLFDFVREIHLDFETGYRSPSPRPAGFLRALKDSVLPAPNNGTLLCAHLEHVGMSNFNIDGQLILDLSEARSVRADVVKRFTISVWDCDGFPDVECATHSMLIEAYNQFNSTKGATST